MEDDTGGVPSVEKRPWTVKSVEHAAQAMAELQLACKFWARGRCSRTGCSFAHTTEVCKQQPQQQQPQTPPEPRASSDVYTAGKNALHRALNDNDASAAEALIETCDAHMLTEQQHSGGLLTPLMMLAMGRCKSGHGRHRTEAMIWRLLERAAQSNTEGGGAVPNIATRSKSRRSAADYAESPGKLSSELVAHLRSMETAELTVSAGCRCGVCGDVLDSPARLLHRKGASLLEWFASRSAAGAEPNPLLHRFFAAGLPPRLLRPEMHAINEMRAVRKECSESLSVIEAMEAALPGLAASESGTGGDGGPSTWHVVDLCCGKGVTATLVSLRGFEATACDRVDPITLPHWGGKSGVDVGYICGDILGPSFAQTLAGRLEAAGGDLGEKEEGEEEEGEAEGGAEAEEEGRCRWKKPVSLLGMHLCGELSIRAIDLFRRIPAARLLVLCPCCLPRKGFAGVPDWIYDDSPVHADQYHLWAEWLMARLAEAVPTATIETREAPDMLSVKNTLIVAKKRPPCSKPPGRQPRPAAG